MNRREAISKNLKEIIVEIDSAAKGRDTFLVAVTKYSPVEDIALAYDCGHRHFGENRVADLFEKSESLSDREDISWHFIGNLQSNKINKLFEVKNLKSIHSVDSLKLLEKLISKEEKLSNNLEVFIQVNTSGEEQKSGVRSVEELREFIELFKRSSRLKFCGLMTMGNIRGSDQRLDAKACFSKLVDLRDQLNSEYNFDLKLSMGMSSDFDIALELGSDYIRVGSRIFKA